MEHGPHEGGRNLTAGNLGIELASRSIGVKNGSCRTCPKVRRSGLCRFRRFPSLLGEPIFAIYEKAGPEACYITDSYSSEVREWPSVSADEFAVATALVMQHRLRPLLIDVASFKCPTPDPQAAGALCRFHRAQQAGALFAEPFGSLVLSCQVWAHQTRVWAHHLGVDAQTRHRQKSDPQSHTRTRNLTASTAAGRR